MTDTHSEVLQIFEASKALLKGHFLLRSGLHSEHFFQCAQVGQYMDKITRLAELLLKRIGSIDCTTVLAPAMGGLVIGQEVARQLGKRFIFAEKVNDALVLRRNFKIESGERILVIEDVVTRGGRVQESIDIILAHGGVPAAVGVLVDRSEGKAQFMAPLHALIQMQFPTYEAHTLPAHLQGVPAIKPGS